MTKQWMRPDIRAVVIKDRFWTPYLNQVRDTMLPYTFRKFEETGYLANFISVAQKDGAAHIGPSFSDGLVLESLRGACDFLAQRPDPTLEALIDRVIDIVCRAADANPDGLICTIIEQNYPDRRWGENGGSIISTHDLYDHGALVEAAISHYNATGKTNLLARAVRAANTICRDIGLAPKKNIVPGHSLSEEAFVKLYRLFRDDRNLDEFARTHAVNPQNYLDEAVFWYEARGNREGRCVSTTRSAEYNQDHATFSEQTTAVGHAVRAMLCYVGAAAVTYETGNKAYLRALNAIWDNVVHHKLHISGGIGTRHDIEGFDDDYALPNDAYLETCAGIALCFLGGEMSLLQPAAEYYDVFEQALYNNVLAAIGEDFTHYFYQNPLISDGSIRRWAWHICPCCPPMLLKLYSVLGTYIYTIRQDQAAVSVHLYLDSQLETNGWTLEQKDRHLRVDSHGREGILRLRIPAYAQSFTVTINGKAANFTTDQGYAVLSGIWTWEEDIQINFVTDPVRVAAHPAVEADRGRIAVQCGPLLYCAEGIDHDGNVELVIPENPELTRAGDTVIGKDAEGKPFQLIPYYRWCRRGKGESDRRMAVWFRQEGMDEETVAHRFADGALYHRWD